MLWRALSRMIVVRLALLIAITAAGPAGVASSWHASGSLEHRLAPLRSASAPAVSVEAGALPPIVATHCEACQFGATLRVWSPPAVSAFVPAVTGLAYAAPRSAALRELPADANAGRAPPRAC